MIEISLFFFFLTKMSGLLEDFPVFNSENNFNAKKRSKNKNKEEELREKTFDHSKFFLQHV